MLKSEAVQGAQYVFDIEKLEPGDIVLSRIPMSLSDTTTWDSHLIQTLSRSPFSFAALHLADGLCIEAVGSGVARLPLFKAGIGAADNVRVLRVGQGSGWVGRKAATCGIGYAKRGFCRSGAPQTKCSAFHDVRRAAVSCSGLVASAYRDAEFPLFEAKEPYTTFPGDFLRSPLLQDITSLVLDRLSVPLQPTFRLDDHTLFDRVHHWEITTQLKVLCNYEVRRVLDIKACKPASMGELELLIADTRWGALDEAVNRGLRWYRYADVYRLKQQHFLGDVATLTPGIGRLLPAALDKNRLACGARAIDADLHQLEAERAHWLRKRDHYNELSQRYNGKTFAYMLDLYGKQLAASEQLLQLKLQQQQAYRNEARGRGLRLKTA